MGSDANLEHEIAERSGHTSLSRKDKHQPWLTKRPAPLLRLRPQPQRPGRANKAVIGQMKESAVRKAAKDKAAATEQADKLNAVELTFERKVGANDVLFGSVTAADIAAEMTKQGYEVDRRKILLDEPLKQLGEFHVPIKLFREINAHVKVTVKSDDPNYVPGLKPEIVSDEDPIERYGQDEDDDDYRDRRY